MNFNELTHQNKICLRLLKKKKTIHILLTYDLAVLFLGIYLKGLKTHVCTKACTHMFIAALFIVAETWKQPQCPSAGEWISKPWYIETTKYYSALNRNELSSHEKTWRNLKCILLRERS